MRRLFAIALLALAACDAGPSRVASQQAGIQTINNTLPRPAILEPPPELKDEAPPPKPKTMAWETPTPIVFTPEDEKVRNSLPFAPAIAMDPIDGGKLSIRATTPMVEYKGKIYYFSSEENKRLFLSNPALYTTGKFTKL